MGRYPNERKDPDIVAVTLDTLSPAAQDEARALGLSNPFRDLPSEVGFVKWFDRIEENFRAISVAECRAVFDRYQGRDAGDLARFRELNAYFCFDEMIERHVRANLDDHQGRLHRRAELYLEQALQFKVAGDPETAENQSPLEDRFLKFRGEVAGRPYTLGQLNQLIKRAPDRAERETAWTSFLPLGDENRALFKNLIVTRNRLAQKLGYRDFIDLKWRQSGIDEQWLLGLMDKLQVETQAAYDEAVRDLCALLQIDRLQPWDVAYGVDLISPLPPETFDQDGATRRLEGLLESWGFNREELGINFSSCGNFTMGGLCFGIEPGKEVAVLISPSDGPRYYRTFFHEYGHAMHFRFVGQDSIFLNVEDMAFNEGMAVFFESFVSDRDWVCANFPELDEADRDQYLKHARYAALAWMRTLLVNVRFEHALYARPEVDPDAFWLELQRTCCGFQLPDSAGPRWAADQMLVSLPVNWQNYVIAELIAKQTREALLERDGKLIGNDQIRAYLFEHYYLPGASVPWMEKVEKATGRPLSADAFFRYFHAV